MAARGSTDGPNGPAALGDPFFWSTDRLIRELCPATASWNAPQKWPDLFPDVLREHEIDGQTLLTYCDIMGEGWFDTLCRELGIRKIVHKTSLRTAILFFGSRSPAFRTWRGQLHLWQDRTPSPPAETAETATPIRSPPAQQPSTPTKTAIVPVDGPAPPSQASAADPSKKRKRLEPTNISSTPLHRASPSPSPDRTRAQRARETLLNAAFGDSDHRSRDPRSAYLGPGKLTGDEVLQGPDPLAPHADDDALPTADFGWAVPWPIPAGRRLQVHLTVRRFLQPNPGRRSRVPAPKSGAAPSGAQRVKEVDRYGAVAGVDADEDDVVLPALGESDDEGYDTETWEAMAQEEEERHNAKRTKNAPLPRETVDAVLADAVRATESRWAAKKLHRLRLREHALWTAARRAGALKYRAEMARREADRFARRFDKLVAEMRCVEWRNEAEVRRQAAVLDASVEDRQLALWEARLYAAPAAPPDLRPEQQQRPPGLQTVRRPVRPRIVDDDEELLTSSSGEEDDLQDDHAHAHAHAHAHGDGLGGFVVDDDSDDDGEYAGNAAHDGTAEDRTMADSSPQAAVANDRTMVDADAVAAEPNPAGSAGNTAATATTTTTTTTARAADQYPLDDMPAIVAQGTAHWEEAGDAVRLLCTVFAQSDPAQVARVLDALTLDDEAIWQKFCAPAMDASRAPPSPSGAPEDDATAFTRFFFIFVTCRHVPPHALEPRRAETRSQLLANRSRLGRFCVQMRIAAPYLRQHAESRPRPSSSSAEVIELDDDEDEDEDVAALITGSAGEQGESPGEEEAAMVKEVEVKEEDDNDDDIIALPRRRLRRIRRDKMAQDLRDKDRARIQEQDARRKALYASLAQSAQISHDKKRLIINTAKEKHHGLVYVHPRIAGFIREHQIEGVRFMWNMLVAPPDVRQGCLLAHTMGLGKTMQVITLLVAIAGAAASPDPAVAAQIPPDLRTLRTLVLCPSGLVENWLDELLAWAPPDVLGVRFHVAATTPPAERLREVRRWAAAGEATGEDGRAQSAVLVLGYPMFRRLLDDFGDEMRRLLEDTPNVVVADEAHALKNPKSRVHALAAHFRTTARIAMTGSPLANSVDEYHSMINWVAPNYLADYREFVAVYANPIKEGFYRDSTAAQKRRAAKMLKVLKETVAPKIHRATVATLKGELPPKTEFILYLPLTPVQLQLYSVFLRLLRRAAILDGIQDSVQLWNLLFHLTLLLAHPKVFRMRLEEMKQHHQQQQQQQQQQQSQKRQQSGGRSGLFAPELVHELLAEVDRRDIDNAASSNKIVVLMGILDEARRVGDKVLVFSQSKLVLDFLEGEFRRQQRRFMRLDGSTASGKRQAMVKDFNVGDDEIYLISTTAGGVGLNIQGANRVVICDFKWNPMHEQQAIGRAYRIGQTKPVFVYWLLMGGTFETVLHDQAVFKTQLASRVVDKKNPSAWADQMRNYTAEPTVLAPDPASVAAALHRQKSSRGSGDAVLEALLAPGSAAQDCICRIVSADTFEEEEPEALLTAEELHEAASMVSRNMMRVRAGPSGADGPQPAAAVAGPPQYDGAAQPRVLVAGASFAPAVPNAAPVPAPLVLLSTGAAPTPAPAPARIPTPSILPSQLQQPPQPLPPPQEPQPADGPLPMQIPTTTAPPQPAPWDAPNPETSSPLMDGRAQMAELLLDSLLRFGIPRELQPAAAKLIVGAVMEEIESELPWRGIPAMAQWRRLVHLAADDNLFMEAVLFGAVSARTLARMTADEEEQTVAQVHAALAELNHGSTRMLPAQPLPAKPNMAAVFGSRAALARVLERQLLSGCGEQRHPEVMRWTRERRDRSGADGGTTASSAARPLAHAIANDVASKVWATIDEIGRRTGQAAEPLLARVAGEAFWNVAFAEQLLQGGLHLATWLGAPQTSGSGQAPSGTTAPRAPQTTGSGQAPSGTAPPALSNQGRATSRAGDPDLVRKQLWLLQNRQRHRQAGQAGSSGQLGAGDLAMMREVVERRERRASAHTASPSTTAARTTKATAAATPSPAPAPALPKPPPGQPTPTQTQTQVQTRPQAQIKREPQDDEDEDDDLVPWIEGSLPRLLTRQLLAADQMAPSAGRSTSGGRDKKRRPIILPPPERRDGSDPRNPVVLD